MNISDEEIKTLVQLRVQKAHESWEETKVIIEEGLWYAAANRMYYSCFYMTNALLISQGLVAKTHAGAIRLLGQHFVMTGKVSQELNSFYVELFELRQRGDYDDYVSVSASDVMPLVNTAEEYMNALEAIIRDNISF